MSRRAARGVLATSMLVLAACATSLQPLRVNVASVEPIAGQSMEIRFLATLRVQNVNDVPTAFDGASAELVLNGKTIGSGVTDQRGSVPRFGETMVRLPVTVEALAEVRQAVGLYGSPDRRLDVTLRGRLQGPNQELPFTWRGELALRPSTGG